MEVSAVEMAGMDYGQNAMRHLMANLPTDLGRKIIDQIMSTLRPEKMREEAERLEHEMVRVREAETTV